MPTESIHPSPTMTATTIPPAAAWGRPSPPGPAWGDIIGGIWDRLTHAFPRKP